MIAICRNCGDRFDTGAMLAAVGAPPTEWRPCPKPSPGRPLADCGVGGHMYDEQPSSAAQDDQRVIIAEGRKHDAEMTTAPWIDDPGSECLYSEHDGTIELARMSRDSLVSDPTGIAWIRNNLGALLDGYEDALDELAAIGAERKRLMRIELEPCLTPEQIANVMAGVK